MQDKNQIYRKLPFEVPSTGIQKAQQKTFCKLQALLDIEDVTAISGTAISTDMFGNFVKNSFKFDVALKHAQDEVPAKKALQKSRNRRSQRTGTGDDKKTSPMHTEHGIVSISRRYPLLQ